MKLILKYGGTSISNTKDIQIVAKYVSTLSKKHQIVIVCSAISGITDDLIEISESIKKENKSKAEQLASKIINRHKQLTKQTIKKSDIQKKLLIKLNEDFTGTSCTYRWFSFVRRSNIKINGLFNFIW